MPPRIAIPMPHSIDREYAERAIPQYERAVELAAGEPVRIPLDQTPAEIMKIIERCDGVLLPGSKADVEPSKFGAPRSPHTTAADPGRDTVDELLLQDAYNMRKPVLGICYGLQTLNVYRTGSLIQHIPDFLPEDSRTRVNHEAGRKVSVAHESKLKKIPKLGDKSAYVRRRDHSWHDSKEMGSTEGSKLTFPVNSSHHQSAEGSATACASSPAAPTTASSKPSKAPRPIISSWPCSGIPSDPSTPTNLPRASSAH